MDGFLQMVACTSEIIIIIQNIIAMFIEREEWLNQILNSDVTKYSTLSKKRLFFYYFQK